MTFPQWAEGIEPEDAPVFPKPNHRIEDGERLGQSRLDAGPTSLKDRLKNLKNKPQDVRPPRERKSIPNKPGQFVQPVEDLYTMIAMGLMPFQPEISMTIMSPSKSVDDLEEGERVEDIPTVGKACAIAWDQAAQRNESVRRVLDGLTGVGVWGTLIGAHMPLIMIGMRNTPMMRRYTNPAEEKEPANA
jgi:hypothetical protein